MSIQSYVDVEGARIAYRMQGEGPPIILVNGTAALDIHWGSVIASLASHRTVISLDYSGAGNTRDQGDPLTVEVLAEQVRGVARSAGAKRFDLVGHSLGAAVAVELCAATPDLVRSLTLVAGFALGAEPRLRLQFELWLDLIRSNPAGFLKMLLLTGLTPSFLTGMGRSAIDENIAAYLPSANWDGIERQVRLDLALDVRRQARLVSVPTLVVSGRHDQIVAPPSDFAALIPTAATRLIDSGHLAYFEAGDEFVSELTTFLDALG